MASGKISDNQITASSEWSVTHAGIYGRLHFKKVLGKEGGWSAAINDARRWLQIDLRDHTPVTRMATQGRNGWNQWVTKYFLQYSDDGNNFQYYKEQGTTTDKVTLY